MVTTISRMQFLRGDLSGRSAPLRPPWAREEALFTSLCTRCGDCISACPTGIIHKGRGGFPYLDFGRGECLFCEDCVRICTPAALHISPGQAPWNLRASLNTDNCLAYRGVECRACADPCESRAIRVQPRIGGVALPNIDLSACNGCGACQAPCPVQALSIQPLRREETA